MSRALELPAPVGRIALVVRPLLAAAFGGLIVAGRFDSGRGYGPVQYGLIGLLAGLLLLEFTVRGDEDRDRLGLRVGLWIMLGVRIAIQAGGAMGPALYPIAYLAFAVLAGWTGLAYTAALYVGFMGLEAGAMAAAGAGAPWAAAVEHGFYLAAFGLVGGLIARRERRGSEQAREVLDRLSADVTEFQRDDTVHRMAGLSESRRRHKDLRSVVALDEAFYRALREARELIPAHTLALYWRPGSATDFHLRELDSERDTAPAKELAAGDGFIARLLDDPAPIRLSGALKLRRGIPSLIRSAPADHLLAAPLAEGGRVAGLLIALRDGETGFSAADEKQMLAAALRLTDLHEHALLTRANEAEAARFRSLANLGHRLSRTLELSEIIDSVIHTGRAIVAPAAAVVVMPDEAGRLTIVAADGEVGEVHGRQVAPESLAARAAAGQAALVIPDLGLADQKVLALGPGLDPARMRTLLAHPLPLAPRPGAVIWFGREPAAFSEYVVRAAGVLADLAAVSIQNAVLYAEMEKRAVTDGLTGLINHRTFQERLADEIERAGRLGTRVAVALADVDHFKNVNDTHGHPVGDEVLRAVAKVLKASIRKVDAAARYGGEEFILILVNADARGAQDLCERIRHKVERLRFNSGGKEFGVTISFGIAVCPDHDTAKERLIELADQSLYRAKKAGRNRTVVAGESKHGGTETQRHREEKKNFI